MIDIDNDEDSDDLVLIGEKFGEGNKRKKIEAVHNGYSDHQDMVCQCDLLLHAAH